MTGQREQGREVLHVMVIVHECHLVVNDVSIQVNGSAVADGVEKPLP